MAALIYGKWKLGPMSFVFHPDGLYNYTNTDSGVQTEGLYKISGDIIEFPQINGSNRFRLDGSTLYMQPLTPQQGEMNAWSRSWD